MIGASFRRQSDGHHIPCADIPAAHCMKAVPMTNQHQRPTMRRVATASLIGTSIEFYDFLIYGTAAALVFGPLFFPSLGSSAATWASVATFGVAFVFRPFGAVLFGHFGDRLGRKKTLVTTLLMMGLATFAIGLVPTAAVMGAGAPLLLVLLRALQGLALGGEWAGAALLTSEYSTARTRGKFSLFPQLGPGVGLVLSSLTFLLTALLMSDQAFTTWGWRVPFLVSILLVALGLWVRLSIAETPSFTKVAATGTTSRLPFADSIREQWRQILLGGGMLSMSLGAFYVAVVFLPGFAGTPVEAGGLGLDRPSILVANIVAGLILCLAVVASAVASDRFGRRRVLLTGTLLGLVVGPIAFAVMEPGSAVMYAVAMGVLMLAHRHPLRTGRGLPARALRGPLPLHRRRDGLQPGRCARRRDSVDRRGPAAGPSTAAAAVTGSTDTVPA